MCGWILWMHHPSGLLDRPQVIHTYQAMRQVIHSYLLINDIIHSYQPMNEVILSYHLINEVIHTTIN